MTVVSGNMTDPPAQSDTASDVRLRLIEQQFAIAPGGDIRLTYRIPRGVEMLSTLNPAPPATEPEPPASTAAP